MKDPYQVLGISRGASDDEVKKAYRAQCKRWHPDLNPNNPSAEEKFKDVQAAYDAITKGEADGPQGGYGQSPYGRSAYGQSAYGQNPYGRSAYGQSGYGQGGYSYDPFGFGFGFGSYGNGNSNGQTSSHSANYSSSDTPELKDARACIVNGDYQAARRILDKITRREGRWYYLSAITHNGLGNSINALQDARIAVQMDPTNNDYRTLLSQLQNPGQSYYRRSTSYGGGARTNPCFSLFQLFLLCYCCGGSRCFYFPMMFCG